MKTFAEREKQVFSFMEAVQNERLIKEEEEAFQNSTPVKLKKLDQCRDDAKAICLDNVFASIYKNAVPLGDEYKDSSPDDLDASFKDFLATRCPKGLEFYVREAIKKGSPAAKKLMEAVENIVDEEYTQKAMNIEDIDPKDLVFNSNDDMTRRLDIAKQELSTAELSDAIRNNVKQTALSEISRAKREKEAIKNLESELANDASVDTQAAVESALELRGYGITRDYNPTLFEAVMVNKVNKLQPRYESGELQEVYTYDALNEYRETDNVQESEEPNYASLEELAFIEAVKEYTGLSVLKALKMESFDKYRLADLTQEYAQQRF